MIGMDRVDSIRKKCRRGEPVAAIARRLGVSRDTVYKHARMEGLSPEPPKARRSRPSKMDRWAPLVGQWLTDGFRENRRRGHTARRAWHRLADECGADAPGQTVRRYAREARLRLGGGPGCFLDLDWPAGVAQAGFGHAALVVRGTRRETPCFVASFPPPRRGARAGVPRRERGVRVPGPQERLRVRRRRPRQGVSATVKITNPANANPPITPTHPHQSRQRGPPGCTLPPVCAGDERVRPVGGNMVGGLGTCREAGIRPDFSDVSRGCGVGGHAVAKRWAADGCEPPDGRGEGRSASEPFREEVEAKAAPRASPGPASTGTSHGRTSARGCPATTRRRSSCARTGSRWGPRAGRSPTRASRRRPACSCGPTGRGRSGRPTPAASASCSAFPRRC